MVIGWIMPMVLAVTAAARPPTDLRLFLDAIRQVETGGTVDPTNAVGDKGRSLGPYQISKAYWQHSGVPGRYQWVRNPAYAERVMIAYWQRNCPTAFARRDWQTLARIHNGGPNGHRDRKTVAYWRNVQTRMQ